VPARHAAITTTSDDHVRFIRCLLNGDAGELDESSLLRRSFEMCEAVAYCLS